jgi:putative acetyltransferase
MPRFSIRPETAADVDAIDRITCAAFQHHPHSDQTEHLIIARLRAAGCSRCRWWQSRMGR